jgi:hypothetical protein
LWFAGIADIFDLSQIYVQASQIYLILRKIRDKLNWKMEEILFFRKDFMKKEKVGKGFC